MSVSDEVEVDTVTLCWAELQQAALVGCQRRIRALAKGRRHRHGAPENDMWGVDVTGAAAEMAVAKALGVFWADAPDPDYDGDVGPYHVRATAHAVGCLILHASDPDDGVFVLAVGTPPTFRVPGWCYGREGKRAEFWQTFTGRPCFMLPQSDLRPLSELP